MPPFDPCGLTAVVFTLIGLLVLVTRVADRYLPEFPPHRD